ncbi:MAG: N-acetyltransferase [Burkholderiales bacterium]|nr:N-acetyltransferase [Burkholderiales bacterium]
MPLPRAPGCAATPGRATVSGQIRILASLAAVAAADWDRLAGDDPFARHAFLEALEAAQCACPRTGWTPCHVTLWHDGALTGAMPLYLKEHSYGEYVFDWGWAQAYQRHGLAYYPKLLCAIPFTPVCGPRLMAATAGHRRLLLQAARALAAETKASSLHVLFPSPQVAAELEAHGCLVRRGVQFHWHNAGYASFDEFLAALAREKRKKIRQERRRVRDEGIAFRRLTGREAVEADWAFFARCYRRTYREHGSTPYLDLDFFLRIAERMPDDLLLIEARRDGRPIAASLNVLAPGALYGRHWGALERVPGLHFEACYYQTIEHCIEARIGRFEGGAQGEHKLARGLMPVETVSAHWVAHREFRRAIADFLDRETRAIGAYVDELHEHSPFRPDQDDGNDGVRSCK